MDDVRTWTYFWGQWIDWTLEHSLELVTKRERQKNKERKKKKKEKKLPKKQEYYLQLALSFIFRPTTHEGINIDVAFEWAWSDFEILFLLKLK